MIAKLANMAPLTMVIAVGASVNKHNWEGNHHVKVELTGNIMTFLSFHIDASKLKNSAFVVNHLPQNAPTPTPTIPTQPTRRAV